MQMAGALTNGNPPPPHAALRVTTAVHCLVAFDVTLWYVRAAIPGAFGQIVAVDFAIVVALILRWPINFLTPASNWLEMSPPLAVLIVPLPAVEVGWAFTPPDCTRSRIPRGES